MQNVWSITGRSIAVSALALALTACQSMRSPEPVAQADIPSSYTNASGTSVAEQGYKNFFADQRLLQVLDLALNVICVLLPSIFNELSNNIRLLKTTSYPRLVPVVAYCARTP